MSDALEIRRNNIRAGTFTLLSLAVGFAILITLNSSALSYMFGSFSSYTLVFSLEDGVAGLSPGAEVRVGGIPSGHVKTISLAGLKDLDDAKSSPHIEVEIEIDRRVALWSNAVAVRTPPVLGTNAWINISTVGGPDQTTLNPTEFNGNKATLVKPTGGLLTSTPGDGLLTTIVGTTNANTTQRILDNIKEFTAFIDGPLIDSFNTEIKPALSEIHTITSTAATDFPGWSQSVTSTLGTVTDASGKLDATMDEALATVTNAREGLRNVTEIVRKNRESINEIIANIDTMVVDGVSITNTIRNESLVKIDNALDAGTTAISDVSNMIRTVELELTASIPTVRTFLQDALVAAGELKLATIEIRRSPWRMLYTPKPGELANENLFAAARGFTIAASEMRSAAESFQSILQRFPDTLETDTDLRKDMESFLADSIARFQDAQARLFSVIINDK